MEERRNWTRYLDKTKEKAPRESLVEALQYVERKEKALDIGAGSLRDTTRLLQEDFAHVVAVDAEPAVRDQADKIGDERLEVVISSFENFAFPEAAFDLVNAQYALPFTSPEHFAEVFERMKRSLKPGGIFVGQLFGARDSWNGKAGMTFHTAEQVKELLAGLTVIKSEEGERDEMRKDGKEKHWHVFQIIARKEA